MSTEIDHSDWDVVVVGSGFGGAICALRLAEAGKSVLVLERGRRYRPGEFPREVRRVDELFWHYPRKRAALGLYDVRFFSGLGAVVASGVGGGSLIYANIHIRPDASVFDVPRWPRSINRQTLDPYYDKVAAMLGIGPVPAEWKLAKRDAWRGAAARLGRAVFDPDQAVAWTEAGGPGRQACQLCAECEFGCQFGAKNTLDFNYLARAERLGARVAPGCLAGHLEPVEGGYRVFLTEVATGARKSVKGRQVFLCAGTLGTNEILLRSRDAAGTLQKLSPRLGCGYSGNGDFLGNLQGSATDLEPWKGPDVTTVMRFDDAQPPFTMAAPTFNQATMRVLASQGQPRLRWLRFLAPLAWPLLDGLLPWAFGRGFFSTPASGRRGQAADPARMTNLFAIGRDNANGRILLHGDGIDIEWNYARENAELIAQMVAAMEAVAREYGARFSPILTWELFRRIITVHSLGGCHLSDTPETGVVNPAGEVHGYRGLYVADGSVVPAAIGFHPVMTICALAEKIAEAAARR